VVLKTIKRPIYTIFREFIRDLADPGPESLGTNVMVPYQDLPLLTTNSQISSLPPEISRQKEARQQKRSESKPELPRKT
jgi:hypothetical protein